MVCCYWLYIKSSPIQLIYYLISVNRTKNELFSYILIVWLELKGTVGSLTEWGPILMKISVVLVPCLNLLPRWNVLKKFKFTSLKKNQILWFWKKILKSKLFKNVRLFSIADPWCIYRSLRRTCNSILWLLPFHFPFTSYQWMSISLRSADNLLRWNWLGLDRGGLLITSRCFVPLQLSNLEATHLLQYCVHFKRVAPTFSMLHCWPFSYQAIIKVTLFLSIIIYIPSFEDKSKCIMRWGLFFILITWFFYFSVMLSVWK